MNDLRRYGLQVLLLLVALSRASGAVPAHDFSKWEKEISAFEASDLTNAPPTNAILFAGSSTIRGWTSLAKDFPEYRVINRGFGGSEVVDTTHFADRIIFPCRPRAIFFRAGGNDIAAGKSPESVFADFTNFVAAVQAHLPAAEIYFIGWSETILRWDKRREEAVYNQLVKEYATNVPRLHYIPMDGMVLGDDGRPRPELFRPDKLHFTPAGYKLLAERVRPFVQQLPPDRIR